MITSINWHVWKVTEGKCVICSSGVVKWVEVAPQESVLMLLSCLCLNSLWLVTVYRCFHCLTCLSSSLCICPGYWCPTFPRIPSDSPGHAGSDQFTVKQVKTSEQRVVPGVVSVNRKWLIRCEQMFSSLTERWFHEVNSTSLMVSHSTNIQSALWLRSLHSCLLAECHSEALRITSGSFLKVIRLN